MPLVKRMASSLLENTFSQNSFRIRRRDFSLLNYNVSHDGTLVRLLPPYRIGVVLLGRLFMIYIVPIISSRFSSVHVAYTFSICLAYKDTT